MHTYVKHHLKKIVLVDYIRLDDPANTGTLRGEMLRAVQRHAPDRVVLTEPGEWRLLDDMRRWQDEPLLKARGLEVTSATTRGSWRGSRIS